MTASAFPLILAHRGACAVAPENTRAAFQTAYRLGADGVELDVMRCATGEIVVHHDETVARLSNGTGRVADLSLAQLRALDFGVRFSPKFAGESIPTLDEVLDDLPPAAFVNIEIKNKTLHGHGEAEQVSALIRRRNLYDRCVVSSFNPLVLWRVRRCDARVSVGYLYEPDAPPHLRPIPISLALRPTALHPHFSVVSEDLVAFARRQGLQLNVWTADEPDELRRLAGLGVNAVITNHPDRLVALRNEFAGGEPKNSLCNLVSALADASE
jgi:glycerophosphoryl diester phosphodiesterase